MIFIRSLLFNIAAFTWTFLLLVLYIPILLLPRASMLAAIRFWIAGIFVLQRVLLRLDFEFRGTETCPTVPALSPPRTSPHGIPSPFMRSWTILRLS